MDAFGLLLWGLSFLAILLLLVLGGRGEAARPGRLEKVYLAVSWLSFPLAIPLLLARLAPPPGPSMPAILTIFGLLRAMLGVLLTIVGLALAVRALRQGRPSALVVATAAINLLPFLTLVFPIRR